VVSQQQVIVLGCSGFLGSHLLDELRREGLRTVGVDLIEPRWADPDKFVRADIRSAPSMSVLRSLGNVSAVVNAAGLLGTSESLNDARGMVETNILGSVLASEVAGALDARYVVLDSGTRWPNPYSISKNTAANLAQAASAHSELRSTIIRIFNAYGPRQRFDGPVRKMVPHFITAALKGQALQIFGNGRQSVDLVHARDCSRAIVLAIRKAPGRGEVIEIGSGCLRSVYSVAVQVINEVGGGRVEFMPMRPGEEPEFRAADLEASRAMLNFVPTPSDDSLVETINWYQGELGSGERLPA
jgi:nucleoside-diphosphate-sugar epimerase